MAITPADHLVPLEPLIGSWRTTGTMLDEQGGQIDIEGTDVYKWHPSGHWIVHEVDVRIGSDQVSALELIGGRDAEPGWQMHAFEATDSPGLMRLTQDAPGRLLLQGDGVRSWLTAELGADHMKAQWERLDGMQWLRWMEMRFDRS